MKRGAAILGLAGASLAAACGPALAQTGTKLRVGTSPFDVAAQAFYAADMGFFARAGLDVEVTSMPSGASIGPAVSSGALDIGAANFVSIAQAHERGVPFVFVAPAGMYSSKSPGSALVVTGASPVRSARDLDGKIVGVNALRNIDSCGVEAWMDKNGGDGTSVQFVEIPMPQMWPALTSGRVVAATINQPYLQQALAAGGRILGRQNDAIASEFCEGAWYCLSSFAASRPDVVRTFYRVMGETARWANRNPDEAGRILEKYSKAPPTPVQYRTIYPERFRAADMQPLIDAAAKYGLLKAAFPATDMIAAQVR